MEVGVDVWIKDESGDQAWLPGVITEKVLFRTVIYELKLHYFYNIL